MAKQAKRKAAKSKADPIAKKPGDKLLLAQVIKDHAVALGNGYARITQQRLELESATVEESGSRREAILEAVDLLCKGAEGKDCMHTLLPSQSAYIDMFVKAAWVASGREGDPIIAVAKAKTPEEKEVCWVSLGVMAGYLRSIFLAGNIASQHAISNGVARSLGIVVEHDGVEIEAWDAWRYLHKSPAWKDLTSRATQIRQCAVAASLISKKQGPSQRQQPGVRRKLSDAKKNDLLSAVEANADNAQDGRRLVYAALTAFLPHAHGASKSALTKLTDTYIAEVNRLLELGLKLTPAQVQQQLTDAEKAMRADAVEGRLQTVSNMTAAAPGTGHEQEVQDRKLAGTNAEDVKRGSQQRAMTAAEAMERGFPTPPLVAAVVDELAKRAVGKRGKGGRKQAARRQAA